jgi:hypothetical protein
MRVVNYFSYVLVALLQIINGMALELVTGAFKHAYGEAFPGKPLPNLTIFLFRCSDSPERPMDGLCIGIAVLCLLIFLELDKERQAYVPVCLTLALGLAWFEIMVVLFGVTMPFVTVITSLP